MGYIPGGKHRSGLGLCFTDLRFQSIHDAVPLCRHKEGGFFCLADAGCGLAFQGQAVRLGFRRHSEVDTHRCQLFTDSGHP